MGRMREARVLLIGKPECHLCEQARDVVARVCGELDVDWAEASILDDPELADRYWEFIPVTFVDGVQLAHWGLTEEQLRTALQA